LQNRLGAGGTQDLEEQGDVDVRAQLAAFARALQDDERH
jgi:hypothetical protein